MSDNKRFWNELSQPPPSALKRIGGGRLKGMTDINPQWRLEVMTEVFGPCGVGWKYSIDRLWTETGNGPVVFAFAMVSLHIRSDKEWSEPIPGIGGNQLVAAESGGPHNNDEAFKMAVTDALSVAMKSLGVASDIYAGLWDGSKYSVRPEDIVTVEQLDSLKIKFFKVNESSFKGMDREALQAEFRSWCRSICGEVVDYQQPASWNRKWHEDCWKALTGVSSDVPFE